MRANFAGNNKRTEEGALDVEVKLTKHIFSIS